MKMSKFKIGDRVRRIRSDFNNLKVGDIRVVANLSDDDDDIYVEGDSFGYASGCFELVSPNYKPKAPTHVVIWEEDSDPARLFTSEDKAKDFIKELSENSSVQKDSILLIEIKSCKKVGVTKSLRYSSHKI